LVKLLAGGTQWSAGGTERSGDFGGVHHNHRHRAHANIRSRRYLDVIQELDQSQEAPREDGSAWPKGGGGMVRADSMEGFEKARYSNWWPHAGKNGRL
jgi:hypothetical protein